MAEERKYLTKFISEKEKSFVKYTKDNIFQNDEVCFIKDNAQLQMSFFVGAFLQVVLKSAYGKYESKTLQKWLSWQVFNKLNLLKIYTKAMQEIKRLDLSNPIFKDIKNEVDVLILKKSSSVSNAKVEFCIYWGMDAYENFLISLENSEEYIKYAEEQEKSKPKEETK